MALPTFLFPTRCGNGQTVCCFPSVKGEKNKVMLRTLLKDVVKRAAVAGHLDAAQVSQNLCDVAKRLGN